MNIINALKVLPDEKKPELYIFYLPFAPLEDIQAIEYPYLTLLPIKLLPLPLRMINRLYRKFFISRRFNLFNASTTRTLMDAAFSLCIPCEDIPVKKQYIWYADLQAYQYPENYSSFEIRKSRQIELRNLRAGYPIVLSSQWCIDDFKRIYPTYPWPLKRLRFATTHPDFSALDMNELRAKFQIDAPYFIVSNQYWIHKNHLVVFKAIKLLKEEGHKVLCLCTGSPHVVSHMAKDYVQQMITYIRDNELDDQIKFLGFIKREEQLCLLKNSWSVIQPSFFESWNTTVEDAKALNKFILLSDLLIHREQLDFNCLFFDPKNEKDLADCMKKVIAGNIQTEIRDYTRNIQQFSIDILEVFELNKNIVPG